MLMFLSLSAELPAETKPHHFVAFQLHKALPPLKHLTGYEFINIYIYIYISPPCPGKAAPTAFAELTGVS